ncbi:MAG TPA: hypothetical protein VFD52_06885 [Clostridia bacterium]|nr:hypothetical protein [Clostridia bacterium]
MREERRYLKLSDRELTLVLSTLILFKNKLMSQGKFTDAVDDVIQKLIKVRK